MIITGLVQIDRLKEEEIIKGIFKFIAEKTQSIEKIGFQMKNNGKIFKTLNKFMQDKELLEVTGKLFKEDKNFYINVIDLKLGKTKYDLFNEGQNDLGIEL